MAVVLVFAHPAGRHRLIKANADASPDLTSHPDMKAGAELWIHDTDTLQRWTGSGWVTSTKTFSPQ